MYFSKFSADAYVQFPTKAAILMLISECSVQEEVTSTSDPE